MKDQVFGEDRKREYDPAAFAEFCRKMGGVDGVDPMEWLKESKGREVLTA